MNDKNRKRVVRRRLEEFASRTGFALGFFDELASTNDEARDARYMNGAVVIAERQSRGRGQRGNSWSSAEGMNLTFSAVLCPAGLRAESQFYLSKAVALSVSDTVDSFGIESRIKWPNDIYVGDGKVAGILIENDLMGACISRSIAGIGLNVNQTAFDPALPNPTSLALQKGAEFDRSEVFERFYGFLTVRCRQLDGGDYGKLDEDYIARLYRFGERHPFVDGLTGERFRGTIWDVLYGGELRVEKETGEICDYLFKEIEYVHDWDGEVSAK